MPTGLKRLLLPLHSLPPELPPLSRVVRRALLSGRDSIGQGRIDEGLSVLTAAFHREPQIALHPWGLLPHLEAQGRGSFKKRLDERLHDWHRSKDGRARMDAVLSVNQKHDLKRWASEHGFATPCTIGQYSSIEAVDWDRLPSRFVLKPVNSSSRSGVVVAIDGYDYIGQSPIGTDVRAYVARRYATEGQTKAPVILEEAVTDCAKTNDPALIIARDFKVFAVAGRAVFTRVLDRNAKNGRRGMINYDRTGFVLPPTAKTWDALQDVPAPDGYENLITEAERASRLLPWLLRFDFYLSPEGPLLGEVTTYPNAGLAYNPFSQRTLLQMWEMHPD